MSTRARCVNPRCPDQLECDVPEFGPPLRCHSCGRELETVAEHDGHYYPETRHDVHHEWPSVHPPEPRPPAPPPAPWNLAVGSVFAGRFTIVRKLGQGGMGAVYQALDDNFERVVALKIPNLGRTGSNAIKRFLREARAMAQLKDQPNICEVIDVVNPPDGVPYLTMEYIDGRTLTDLLKKEGRLPVDEASRIVAILARALGAAHALKIIHRDLKPDNVMIRDDGTPVLMDFGLVRRDSDERITVARTVMGTLPYMSPEQAMGENDVIGPASDIYALGVILYELLTGQRPFNGRNESIIVAQILKMEPIRPSVHRPGLDPQLEAICLKAMAKAPADRQGTMNELAEGLEALASLKAPIIEVRPSPPTVFNNPAPPPSPPPVPRPVAEEARPARAPEPVTPPVKPPLPKPDRKPILAFAALALILAVTVGVLIQGGYFTQSDLTTTKPGPGEIPKGTGEASGPVAQAKEPRPEDGPVAPTSTPTPVPPKPGDPVPGKPSDRVIPAPPKPPAIREVLSEATGMTLVFVDGGRFTMGSSKGAKDEAPPQLVEIRRPFFLGKFEVTQAEYLKVVGRNPSKFLGDDHRPVESVTWLDAVRFCNGLSEKDGLPLFYTIVGDVVTVANWSSGGYRLPTEAEWEYACRAGRKGEYGDRDDAADLARLAWFEANSKVNDEFVTHPDVPGHAPAHPLGLRNMQGNVQEWCWDWYADPRPPAPAEDPVGPSTGPGRVIRGGSYGSDADGLRPSARRPEPASSKLRGIGFRVARNAN